MSNFSEKGRLLMDSRLGRLGDYGDGFMATRHAEELLKKRAGR
jgi:hypothetical protein